MPKKSEKFEFRNSFFVMFLSGKNCPGKRNFDIFRQRIFRKINKIEILCDGIFEFIKITFDIRWYMMFYEKKTLIDMSTFTHWIIQIHCLDRPLSSFRPSTFTLLTVHFHPFWRTANFPSKDRPLSGGPSTFRQKTVHFPPFGTSPRLSFP